MSDTHDDMASREWGPAYRLWERIQAEMRQQELTIRDVVTRTGVSDGTLSRLRTTAPRSVVVRERHVRAIAKGLGIPEDEALHLAGLGPAPATAPTVRELVETSDQYDEQQKAAILAVIDMADRINKATQTGEESA